MKIPCSLIENLNLDNVIRKLTDKEHDPYSWARGWSHEQASRACLLYKSFLYLQKKYPEKSLTPIREIDEVWHLHILDTKKYIQDCQDIFGYYLHHNVAPIDSEQESAQMLEATIDLVKKEFPDLV